MVSALTIITSMKLRPIPTTPNLKRDATMRTTSNANDSAAESPGLRKRTSQTALTNAQLKMKATICTAPLSHQIIKASAARWNIATGAIRAMPCRASASAGPDASADRNGGMSEVLDQACVDQH